MRDKHGCTPSNCFQGICDTPGAEEYYRTSLDPTASTTTTTTSTSTTTSPLVSQVNTALLAQIQRCIQTPLHCNTNLIPAPVIRSTISTTTTTISTTTSAKPSSAKIVSNSFREQIRNCLFNHICWNKWISGTQIISILWLMRLLLGFPTFWKLIERLQLPSISLIIQFLEVVSYFSTLFKKSNFGIFYKKQFLFLIHEYKLTSHTELRRRRPCEIQ